MCQHSIKKNIFRVDKIDVKCLSEKYTNSISADG